MYGDQPRPSWTNTNHTRSGTTPIIAMAQSSGVLTDGDGGKLPFLDQPVLFGLLAGSGAGDLLAEGKSVFDGPPELVAEQLAIPAVQAWAREWFSSAGLAAPVDFDGP